MTRSMKVQPTPEEILSDDIMQEWLSLVHGVDEAERAMRLPADVRQSMYWAMTYYGPAGEEVVAFLTAVEAGLKKDNPDEWLSHSLSWLGGAYYSEFVVRGVALQEWTVSALPANQSSILNSAFGTFKLDVRSGVAALGWLLTGQYLFQPELVANGYSDVLRANEVLEHLQLPALHGTLASFE